MHTVTAEDFTERPGGLYYTGPLDPAKAFIRRDHWVNESTLPSLLWEVTIAYGPDEEPPAECAEWGRGKTIDEAWRYALGAAFGPIDPEFRPIDLTDFKE